LLQRRNAPRVNDPVVLVRKQLAMNNFQFVAFVREMILGFPTDAPGSRVR
jgi:hypothetical protein